MIKISLLVSMLLVSFSMMSACNSADNSNVIANTESKTTHPGSPDYFNFRPKVEKDFGYSYAVRIGDEIKISGAVSMDSIGTPLAAGDLDQQMKNCYGDLGKILQHYGCTFDDVTVENIFTTSISELEKVSGYRQSIYKKNFPTGTWVEVKALASPAFMIEIELEAHKSR